EDTLPEQVLTALANDWLQAFEKATASSSADEAATAVVELFEEEGYWRDLLAFTWNLITAEGADEIAEMIRNTWPSSIFRNVELKGEPANEGDGVTRVHFSCESADFKCTGIVRLRNGKAWTLLTSARELLEHPEPKGRKREMGVVHGQNEDTRNWTDRKNDRQAALGVTEQPYTLIIGGGQGGIALGARLKRL